jgi:Protein kinase domain
MPYMSGGSLAERVTQHGPAPSSEVERQARRLVGALSSAHQAGIVHRDIKPANILFNDRGEPCLADFGVALSHDQTHGLTVAGMVVGTPGFMAPEQARGEPVSPATDVFSLGATLLYAATGDGPYGQGDPGLLMVRAASGKVQKVPRSLPGSLRRLLRSMLDPRPDRRPTAAALAGRRPPVGPGGRGAAIVGACIGVAALAVAGVAVTTDRGGGELQESGDAEAAPEGEPGTAPEGAPGPAEQAAPDEGCTDLPYQPCGADPAPHTDGRACVDDHADYDGDPANGCEAEPDSRDGEPLVDRIQASIVPADDVDTYPLALEDGIQTVCDGVVVVRLDAPPGMELQLDVLLYDEVVQQAAAVNGAPAVVTLSEEVCGPDAVEFELMVRPVGEDRVPAEYVLSRSGNL